MKFKLSLILLFLFNFHGKAIDMESTYKLSTQDISSLIQSEDLNCTANKSEAEFKNCILNLLLVKMLKVKSTFDQTYGKNDNVYIAHLHQKNSLAFNYVYENLILNIKGIPNESYVKNQLNNLDLLTAESGDWNNLISFLKKFDQHFAPVQINQQLKNSQILMAYYSNGSYFPSMNTILGLEDNTQDLYSFLIKLSYSFMKAHIDGQLGDIYGQILHYMGPRLGHPGNRGLQSKKSLASVFDNIDKFESDYVAINNDPTLSTVDFFWQAHNGDAPFHQSFLNKFPNDKLRFINNTWCSGVDEFSHNYSPEMANYIMVSRGVNNPFPYNFINNYFLKFNLPVKLTEVMSRLVHLKFYKNVTNSINLSNVGLITLNATLDLYSSWFDHYGDDSFSLADSSRISDPKKKKNFTLNQLPTSNKLNDFTAPLNYNEQIELGPILSPLATYLLKETTVGISLAKFNGLTSADLRINHKNINDFLRNTLLDSLTITLHSFLPVKFKNQIDGLWLSYKLPEQSISEFRSIANDNYSKWNDNYSILIRYLVSHLSGIEMMIKDNNEQLQLNLKLDKEIRGNIPFLSTLSSQIIRGFQLGKDINILLTFIGENKISLKINGLKVYTTFVYQIDLPEIIVDLKSGDLQILHEGFKAINLVELLK